MSRLWIDPSEPDYAGTVAFTCDQCDADILHGDDYYEIEGDRFCERCANEHFEDMKLSAQREAI